ncbi:MAG: nucleotide exchange factor GrpE [Fuerstiella sp.]|nr:nucleotide exchange factor GrpE [Fuerstiella sp.]MCP4858383.1 nucleotide exchange factor GrpE [Fuerstiella sp.]
MSDPDSFSQTLPDDDVEQEQPQFGLLDVVEAFTAMRHEYRGQAKEGRELAQQLHASTDEIRQIGLNLKNFVACHSTDEAHQFVRVIIDLDTQLTRAVDATIRSEAVRRRRQSDQQAALRNVVKSMSPIARWFARPLIRQVEPAGESLPDETSSVTEGFSLLLARLRQTMDENEIERLDTLSLPFDAEVMNSIGTIESADLPPGHVGQQLSPGYRWRGNLLRFADVRISK